VPRYFFKMVDGHSRSLVKDSEGAEFSGVGEARKEAVGLARDVARHGLRRSTTWQVVVTDETGDEVLTVLLSEVGAGKISAWRNLERFPFLRNRERALASPENAMGGHIASLEPGFRTRIFVWLVAAAVLAIIGQAALTTFHISEKVGRYQTASAPTQGAVVAVRFVADARAADITEFLNTYKASLVGGPRPGGFYRLSLADQTLPEDELADVVRHMTQETIVEFAAVVP
jgi:hypothetical protein